MSNETTCGAAGLDGGQPGRLRVIVRLGAPVILLWERRCCWPEMCWLGCRPRLTEKLSQPLIALVVELVRGDLLGTIHGTNELTLP
jgi:hypothetical protein